MTEPDIVELRQYTLLKGQRETLIRLFHQEFVAPQNEVGAQVLGTFTDADDPDRFVWFRGFADMETRKSALSAFYSGPVWQAHRNAANATMRDSDNVLLLRRLSGRLTPPVFPGSARVWTADIWYVQGLETARFADFFEATLRPRLRDIGIEVQATLATAEVENTFPRLPVREHEHVFVALSSHGSPEALSAKTDRLRALSGWRDKVPDALLPTLMRKPERLRLVTTLGYAA